MSTTPTHRDYELTLQARDPGIVRDVAMKFAESVQVAGDTPAQPDGIAVFTAAVRIGDTDGRAGSRLGELIAKLIAGGVACLGSREVPPPPPPGERLRVSPGFLLVDVSPGEGAVRSARVIRDGDAGEDTLEGSAVLFRAGATLPLSDDRAFLPRHEVIAVTD